MKMTSETNSQIAMAGTKAPRMSTSASIQDLPQQQRCFQQARAEDLAAGERGEERLAFLIVLHGAGQGERPAAQRARVPGGLDDLPAGRMQKTRRGSCDEPGNFRGHRGGETGGRARP